MCVCNWQQTQFLQSQPFASAACFCCAAIQLNRISLKSDAGMGDSVFNDP